VLSFSDEQLRDLKRLIAQLMVEQEGYGVREAKIRAIAARWAASFLGIGHFLRRRPSLRLGEGAAAWERLFAQCSQRVLDLVCYRSLVDFGRQDTIC
jgi:hypothetical protein